MKSARQAEESGFPWQGLEADSLLLQGMSFFAPKVVKDCTSSTYIVEDNLHTVN